MTLQKYFGEKFEKNLYVEKTFKGTPEEYKELLHNSSTIYVSGLPDDLREERVWQIFSIFGSIRRVIMGVNRNKLVFCGFLFVEFENAEDAEKSIEFFEDFPFESRFINVNKDIGFVEGRQFGRGLFGGTMKNDKRVKYYRR